MKKYRRNKVRTLNSSRYCIGYDRLFATPFFSGEGCRKVKPLVRILLKRTLRRATCVGSFCT